MQKYINTSICIFIALAASRFVPHPPNFTSLIALSFYVPTLLGKKYLPALVFSFVMTDFFIGFHPLTLFTWGSVILISFVTPFFKQFVTSRIAGVLIAATIFFIITNFGVWSFGGYGYNFEGLIICYTLALPFFGNTLISTLIFSGIIEMLYSSKFILKKFN